MNQHVESRTPSSHELAAKRPWDDSYREGPAPWDIGAPQPAIVRLGSRGAFAGTVLDAGCGTGENSLYIASLGLPVLGVDVAETAIGIAQTKAAERLIAIEFAVADAFHLSALARRFNTVLDCGLFHTCDSEERRRYVASLASVMEPGGSLHILCFSDVGPDLGPHPVSEHIVYSAFEPAGGWQVTSIEPERIETRMHENGAAAWLVNVARV